MLLRKVIREESGRADGGYDYCEEEKGQEGLGKESRKKFVKWPEKKIVL